MTTTIVIIFLIRVIEAPGLALHFSRFFISKLKRNRPSAKTCDKRG